MEEVKKIIHRAVGSLKPTPLCRTIGRVTDWPMSWDSTKVTCKTCLRMGQPSRKNMDVDL